jgi:hypothetical protein
MNPDQFLDQVLFHNSMRQWLTALAVSLAAFVALLLIRYLLVGRLGEIAKRTTTEVDDVLVELVARTTPYFLAAAALVFGSHFLALPPTLDMYFDATFALVLLVQCGLWGSAAVDLWIQRQAGMKAARADVASVTTIRALGIGAKLVLWVIVFITALDKFGVNVTTLVTGLGIGGVAIALAVQNVLGDLFAALSIVFDKPFDVGDSIAVDQIQGTVERIGAAEEPHSELQAPTRSSRRLHHRRHVRHRTRNARAYPGDDPRGGVDATAGSVRPQPFHPIHRLRASHRDGVLCTRRGLHAISRRSANDKPRAVASLQGGEDRFRLPDSHRRPRRVAFRTSHQPADRSDAVHSDRLTGDVRRLLGGEKRRERGELLRLAEASHRNLSRNAT